MLGMKAAEYQSLAVLKTNILWLIYKVLLNSKDNSLDHNLKVGDFVCKNLNYWHRRPF